MDASAGSFILICEGGVSVIEIRRLEVAEVGLEEIGRSEFDIDSDSDGLSC